MEATKNLPDKKKLKAVRPNIDHLIKRILVERRKSEKRSLLIFSAILLIVATIITLKFN
jgi:hypothetical protein